MHRRNQTIIWIAGAFGLGILMASILPTYALVCLLAVLVIVISLLCLKQRR
jgi:4-hydroxybenzoate polyprenyltransferase